MEGHGAIRNELDESSSRRARTGVLGRALEGHGVTRNDLNERSSRRAPTVRRRRLSPYLVTLPAGPSEARSSRGIVFENQCGKQLSKQGIVLRSEAEVGCRRGRIPLTQPLLVRQVDSYLSLRRGRAETSGKAIAASMTMGHRLCMFAMPIAISHMRRPAARLSGQKTRMKIKKNIAVPMITA